MRFGDYFKNLRISKNITQKQIADAIGKNPMLVSNVENNKSTTATLLIHFNNVAAYFLF